MRDILHTAVEKGTGKQAKVDSLAVGGKTGTSKLVIEGKYSNDKYYSSFIGFYPVDKPEAVCYVLITKPKGEYYGGLVSAPVFKNIVSRIHSLEKRTSDSPNIDTEIKTTEIKTLSDNKKIVQKEILPARETNRSKNVFVSGKNLNIMPDLKGMTIKEAVSTLNEMGIKWSISGAGIVVEQSITPGQAINKRKTCMLTCSQITSSGARIY
jgi:cell division protein FtsI (penicillin-binding protein 3)